MEGNSEAQQGGVIRWLGRHYHHGRDLAVLLIAEYRHSGARYDASAAQILCHITMSFLFLLLSKKLPEGSVYITRRHPFLYPGGHLNNTDRPGITY